MKYFTLITFLLYGMVVNAQIDTLRLKYEHFVLDNGLEVILQPDTNVSEVSVEFWLKKGISFDPPAHYGFSHFFEHVMPFSEMDSLTRAKLAAYRTGSNAQVKKDYSRFYVKVRSEGLELALQMAAGRLECGAERITNKRVEYQRKRVLAEINRNAKNPIWSAEGGMAIYRGTFGEKHPYGSGGYGRIENNERFRLEAFRDRYNEVVYARNVVLFLVGNFDVQAARNYINKYFKEVPPGENDPLEIDPPNQSTARISMDAPSETDSMNTLVYSWAVPAWGTEEDGVLNLISKVLSQRLEEVSDMPASVNKLYADTDMFQYAGQFLIKATFSLGLDSTQVEHLILKEIESLTRKGISETELNNAKQEVLNDIIEKQENLGFQWSRTELLGESLLFTGNPDAYYERLRMQLDVEQEMIAEVVEEWLDGKPFRILFTSNEYNN